MIDYEKEQLCFEDECFFAKMPPETRDPWYSMILIMRYVGVFCVDLLMMWSRCVPKIGFPAS